MKCLLLLHRWTPWSRFEGGYWPNALLRACKKCGKVQVR